MNMTLALDLLGSNRSRHELAMMRRALTLHSWLNSDEEVFRLEAAAYVLRRWSRYAAACNAIRDRKPR